MVELKVIGRIRPMRLPGIVPVAPRNVSSSGIGSEIRSSLMEWTPPPETASMCQSVEATT